MALGTACVYAYAFHHLDYQTSSESRHTCASVCSNRTRMWTRLRRTTPFWSTAFWAYTRSHVRMGTGMPRKGRKSCSTFMSVQYVRLGGGRGREEGRRVSTMGEVYFWVSGSPQLLSFCSGYILLHSSVAPDLRERPSLFDFEGMRCGQLFRAETPRKWLPLSWRDDMHAICTALATVCRSVHLNPGTLGSYYPFHFDAQLQDCTTQLLRVPTEYSTTRWWRDPLDNSGGANESPIVERGLASSRYSLVMSRPHHNLVPLQARSPATAYARCF
ncbi:hypothetical protein K438DRAFT_262726 [Mycena galopus ATCC 62051]|nr:hypothetical protein K438DRAFT_262726 [Mycena galopus ATCC 62051]